MLLLGQSQAFVELGLAKLSSPQGRSSIAPTRIFMTKRSDIRQHYQTEANQAAHNQQFQDRTAQLNALEDTVINAFNTLIRFIDGKTTKTEVVNQLKSISTPDVDKVVTAISKLDKDILANKLDIKPLEQGLNSLKRELSLIPKSLPKIPEQKDKVAVTNLKEIKLDTTPIEKAIKALKLDVDVKAPIINVDAPNLKPLQDVMLDIIKAISKIELPEVPTTDLKTLETEAKTTNKKLDEANKHLKKIVDKPVGGGGGGGGNGTPYQDSSGTFQYVQLQGGSIPVVNPDGSNIGGGGLTNTELRAAPIQTTSPIYKLLLDDTSTTNVTYVGKAAIGSATSASVWQIQKIDETTGMSITWAGTALFTAKWDDRTTETYA